MLKSRLTFFLEEDLLSPRFEKEAQGLSVTQGFSGWEIGRVIHISPAVQFGRKGYRIEVEICKTISVSSVDLNVSMGCKRDPS